MLGTKQRGMRENGTTEQKVQMQFIGRRRQKGFKNNVKQITQGLTRTQKVTRQGLKVLVIERRLSKKIMKGLDETASLKN